MTARRPRAATVSWALPSLAALAAGAAGCENPSCTDTRSGELDRHGANGRSRLDAGDYAGLLREVGLAVGLVRHTPEPEVMPAGAIAPVTQVPIPQPPPPQVPPQLESQPTGGAPMEVLPTPPTPPRPPRVQPRPPPRVDPPRDPEVVMGRRASVGPGPRN
ncbi:MAG: hypothetical protein HY909_28845 [Deltaproteobacteria bacterium]|nr:hypothetical protein [Deltaproteobacteria bacterium]